MHLLTIIGTRPETIKMAPVIKAFQQHRNSAKTTICLTGQHRELTASILELFGICADVTLDVMTENQSLAGLTSRLLTALDAVVTADKYDWIVAQGDTTSVLAASLVAYYHRIRFAHVEAGLRTDDLFSPYPEELNRRVADEISDRLFAPTEQSRRRLLSRGIDDSRILVTGNTVIDAFQQAIALPFDWNASAIGSLSREAEIVLVTTHRRESFGTPLRQICGAVRGLAERYADRRLQFAVPVHPNPNVKPVIESHLSDVANVRLLPPLDYLTFVNLMKQSRLILTDSGGIQEEATSLGIPTLVMREKTERPEGIEAGVTTLVGTQTEHIVASASALLDEERSGRGAAPSSPFGDGRAGERIARSLLGQPVEPFSYHPASRH